jgi:hypothetical protein
MAQERDEEFQSGGEVVRVDARSSCGSVSGLSPRTLSRVDGWREGKHQLHEMRRTQPTSRPWCSSHRSRHAGEVLEVLTHGLAVDL